MALDVQRRAEIASCQIARRIGQLFPRKHTKTALKIVLGLAFYCAVYIRAGIEGIERIARRNTLVDVIGRLQVISVRAVTRPPALAKYPPHRVIQHLLWG